MLNMTSVPPADTDVTMGGASRDDAEMHFPLTAISRDHKSYDKLTDAVKTAMTERTVSFDPNSSADLLFWLLASDSIGVGPNDALQAFRGRANALCADIFLELATEHLEAKHHQVYTLPSPEQRDLFSQNLLESIYATNILKLVTDYSNRYRDGAAYHSPYTALVQASMTGKSRAVKQMAQYVYCILICLQEPLQSGYPQARFC
jgi:hypothetical protein